MRELKSYRDPYVDNKPKPAFFGPYRRRKIDWYSVLLTVTYVIITFLLLGGVI